MVVLFSSYILMHITLLGLFLSSQGLKSSLWLSMAILAPSIVALLFALHVSTHLCLSLGPAGTSETSPFVVCTIGFDKPLRLVRIALSHIDVFKWIHVLRVWIASVLALFLAVDKFSQSGSAPRSSAAGQVMSHHTAAEVIPQNGQEVVIEVPNAAVFDLPCSPSSRTGIHSAAEDGDRILPLSLDVVDLRLAEVREAVSKAATVSAVEAPPRTLTECIDIYERGTRPASVALAMLTNEDIIMLAQAGKIGAYALEKVLANNERAVVIRRALICESRELSIEISSDEFSFV